MLGKILKPIYLIIVAVIFAAVGLMQANFDVATLGAALKSPFSMAAAKIYLPCLAAIIAAIFAVKGEFTDTVTTTFVQDEGEKTRDGIKSELEKHTQDIIAGLKDILPANSDTEGQEGFEDTVRILVEGHDHRKAPATEALEDGRLTDAIAHLEKVANQEAAAADDFKKNTAETYREAATLAYPIDTAKSIKLFEKAIEYGESRCWTYIYLSRLYVRNGNSTSAIKAAGLAEKNSNNERDRVIALCAKGDVAIQQNDLFSAKKSYELATQLFKQLTAGDPSNAGYQRDLSVSYNKLGDIAAAQNDLVAARQAYDDGLAIRKALAEGDPSNAGYQRDLSVSYERLGDIAAAQNDLGGARQAYDDGLAIAKILAEGDPSNAGYQRDLSVSYERLGDIAAAQNDLGGARQAYDDGLAIRKTLAEDDPSNAGYQRDLMVSYYRLAGLGGSDEPRYWQASYDVLKKLDDAGKLLPADQTWYEILKEKIGE